MRLRWSVPLAPPPKHPVRDTIILYGALATIVVIFAWATGGPVGRSVIVAALFFVAATAWSLYRLRARLRASEQRSEE